MDNFAKPIIDSYINTLNHEFVLIQYNILYTNTINNGFILEEIRIYILHITNCLIFSFYMDTLQKILKVPQVYPLGSVILLAYVETMGQGEFEVSTQNLIIPTATTFIRQTSLHELNDRDWNTIMDS